MKVKLKRQIKTTVSTIGQWYIESNYIGLYSLEDRDRDLKQTTSLAQIQKIKVKKQTAIPITNISPYELMITKSDRFTKQFGFDFYTIQVMNVPAFGGIRIHWGTKDIDTDGCPLVGKDKNGNQIMESRVGYKEFLTHFTDILGFTIRMIGNLAVIEPIKNFVQKEKVYLYVESNY